MPVVVFLSPHLDDAVFSCPARILAEVRDGVEVIIATVFSHCGPDHAARPEYRRRRSEDQSAARILGASPHWLGMRDAPFRNPYYNCFRNIIFGTAPGEETPLTGLCLKLHALVATLQPVRLYFPLGVGNHIDHRLTFEVAARVPTAARKVFYEERPYAFVQHAVPWRLSRLGLKHPNEPFSDAAHWHHLLRARYVRAYLPPGLERRRCRQLLESFPVSRGFQTIGLQLSSAAKDDVPQLREAIFAYSSQTPDFFGSRTAFRRASRQYARSLGSPEPYAERYWHLSPDA